MLTFEEARDHDWWGPIKDAKPDNYGALKTFAVIGSSSTDMAQVSDAKSNSWLIMGYAGGGNFWHEMGHAHFQMSHSASLIRSAPFQIDVYGDVTCIMGRSYELVFYNMAQMHKRLKCVTPLATLKYSKPMSETIYNVVALELTPTNNHIQIIGDNTTEIYYISYYHPKDDTYDEDDKLPYRNSAAQNCVALHMFHPDIENGNVSVLIDKKRIGEIIVYERIRINTMGVEIINGMVTAKIGLTIGAIIP